MTARLHILALLLLALVAGAALASGPSDAPDEGMRLGSLARQQFLKYRLQQASEGTLVSALGHNRREWESLSPQQRQRLRDSAYAFLRQSDDRQQELVRHYDQVIKGTAQQREAYEKRARWLRVVVESFTPEQRQQMSQMTTTDRARMLLERRDLLVSQGKLVLEPDTQPASAPAPAEPGQP